MYKPPQNCNRVKSIKSKFENIENQKDPCAKISPIKNGLGSDVAVKKSDPLAESSSNNHQIITRQLSDPSKRNIKRTPAFRVDKNSEKACGVQRIEYTRTTLFEKKVKQFNSVKSCDKVEKVNSLNGDSENCEKSCFLNNNNEVEVKSSDFDRYNKSFNLISSQNSDLNSNFSEKTNFIFKGTQETSSQCSVSKVISKKKPILPKSKSSHDFQYIRSKFDNRSILPSLKDTKSTCNNAQYNDKLNDNEKSDPIQRTTQFPDEHLLLKNVDLSLLYTEPVPKSLRNTHPNKSPENPESPIFKSKIETIYSKSTLQLADTDKKEFLDSLKHVLQQDLPDGLTDTLKTALTKPLPGGPAPQKPPRTFQHCGEAILTNGLQKNPSFLHVAKQAERKSGLEKKGGQKKVGKKGDPKYMLNKLENALKNNKLRARKQQKVEVLTTSGEDSDDSLLFRSKSSRSLPKVPKSIEDRTTTNVISSPDSLLGDFNCFNGFGCRNPAYERIKEPNSSFFVDPIYAEPIQCRSSSVESKKSNRNSLYYMSTALLSDRAVGGNGPSSFLLDLEGKMEDLNVDSGVTRQISAENSSLSSFASDVESSPSPVADDPHAKIRYLIENFEAKKRQTLPKTQKFEEKTCDNSARVESLKNTLKMTLDKSFSSEQNLNSKDSDSEKNGKETRVANIVAKFQTYRRTAPKYCQPKIDKDTLFYCCLVIEKVRDCAQIKLKFPPNVDIPSDIEHLCFPESPDTPPLDGTNAAQTYSLLVTNQKGERTFGYCRRVLPEGSTHCLPLAYCILSKYRAPRFYKKILIELESRHGMQNKYRDELISQFYFKKFPRPGESIKINLSCIEPKPPRNENKSLEESLDLTSYVHVNKTGEYGTLNSLKPRNCIFVSENDVKDSCLTPSYVAYEGNRTELVLTLHPDTRYEDSDLKKLHKLPTEILLKIFSSLLLERKVILISSVISELSSCVDSLQSVLYPFTWYHTLIPILPESLWDIVESPTPVVCGVLSVDAIDDRRIENGIVVNLDTRSVLAEEGDENKILSGSMQKVWRRSIALANKAAQSMDYVHSVYLADAYLQVFICCLKTYKDYVLDGRFLKDDFVKNAKTKGIRRFLKMFTETCMFHAFMDTALNNPDSLTAFDKKIEMYGSEESNVILDKLLEWNR